MSKRITAVLILVLLTARAKGAERPFDVKLVVKTGDLIEGKKVGGLSEAKINDKGQTAYTASFVGKLRWETAICLDKKMVIDTFKRERFGYANRGIQLNNQGDLLYIASEGKPPVVDPRIQHDVAMTIRSTEGDYGVFLNDKVILNAAIPPLANWHREIHEASFNNAGLRTFMIDGEIYAIKPDNHFEKIGPPKVDGISVRAFQGYQLNDSGDFVSRYEWRKGATPTEAIFTKTRFVAERPKSEKQRYVAWGINNAGKVAILDEVFVSAYDTKYRVLEEETPMQNLLVKMQSATNRPTIQINDRGTILVGAQYNVVMIRGGKAIPLLSDEIFHDASLWNPLIGHPVLTPDSGIGMKIECGLNNNDVVACSVQQSSSAFIAQITPKGSSAPLQELVPVSRAVTPETQQEAIKEVAKPAPAEKKPEAKGEDAKPESAKVVTVMMRSQTVYKGEYVGGDTQCVFLQVEGNLLKLKIKDVDTVVFATAETAKGKPDKAEKGKPSKTAPDKPSAAERMAEKTIDIWMKGKK